MKLTKKAESKVKNFFQWTTRPQALRLCPLLVTYFCLLIFCLSPFAEDETPRVKRTTKRERKAHRLLNTGQNQKVIDLLNPYTDQLSVPAYIDLASAYGNLRDIKNEVRVLRILNDRDNENYESHFILGNGLWRLLKSAEKANEKKAIEDELVQAFRKSIGLNPKHKASYDSLLNYFLGANLNYEARQLLSEMVDQFGKRPELLNDQCRLFSIDGYLSQTVETCTEAIALAKGYADNYVYLGQAYIEQGETAKGGKIIRLAAKKFPEKEITQWAAGKYYFDKENYPVATRYLSSAVRANPEQARSQLGLGQALFKENRLKLALKHLLKACQIDQKHKDVILVYATQLRLDRKTAAADRYKKTSYQCVSKSARKLDRS